MAHTHPLSLRLDVSSAIDMLDILQSASEQFCKAAGLDDDSMHWVSMAVRESVLNAIAHGNRHDPAKRVFVTFEGPRVDAPSVSISVRDQGEGFDPDAVADPLAPENLLKGSGRGIFLMRSFMDDVVLERSALGGMEVRMTKKAQPAPSSGLTEA